MTEQKCENCRHLLAANCEWNYCCERASMVTRGYRCNQWMTLELAASVETHKRFRQSRPFDPQVALPR